MPCTVRRLLYPSLALTLGFVFVSCTDNGLTAPPTLALYTTPTGLVTSNPPEIFVGAGDISTCNNNNDEATAQLLDAIPGTVYALGDNVYENGTTSEYNNCYDPTWGRHKARTWPSAGNHEYNTSGATPYYNYFGARAGDPSKGYYSYDLGAWHVIVLNSNISRSAGSAQDTWLRADLAAHPNLCTVAYFHHPLYSSTGGSGSGGVTYSSVRPFYDALYEYGADLVLAGHRHFYERMTPMKPDGSADNTWGTRHIIVGTGGRSGGSTSNVFPRSEVRNDTYGVLKLYLYEDSYAWKFIPIAGQTFTDSGSTACHGVPGSSGGGGVSASQTTVAASPTSITASSGSSSSTITVTARDANGDPVSGATVVLSATGSGNTINQPGTTNASGVATGTLSSTDAGPKTVSAIVGGVSITQKPVVTVGAGPPSAGQSTVNASPTSIMVGSGTSTITVTVKDAFDNPVSGANVSLAATGGGNVLTQPATATDGNGQTTGTLSSTVAEMKTVSATANGTAITQTATVDVSEEPPAGGGDITHTLLTAGNATPNQSDYTTVSISPAPNALVTVAVMGHRSSGALASPVITGGGMTSWTEVADVTFDDVGSPHKRVTVYRAMSASPGSGPINISFERSVSNSQWIVSQWQGVETSGVNGSGAIGQIGANAGDGVNGLSVALGAFSSSTNVAYGVFGVRSGNLEVTPGAGFTEISEQPSGETPADLMAEWAVGDPTIDASWSNLHGGALGIEIKAGGAPPGGVSASQSTLSAAPTSIPAGNPGTVSTITVTAKDASGDPVSGASVVLSATGSNNTIVQPGPTDASGVATGTLSSTTAETKVVSATADGVGINQTATVIVDPAGAATLAFIVQPSNTVAGSPIAPAVQVEILDQYGNRVTSATNDVTLSIGTNPGGGTLSGTTTLAAVNGVSTFSNLSINNVGIGYTLSASGTGIASGATSNAFNITGVPPSASLSTVNASPTSITASNGSSISTITVTARDAGGNPISGATVVLAATGSGNVLTQPAGPTGASGMATGTLSSTAAGPKTVSATIDGVAINQMPVVTVDAGAPSATQSTVNADPTSILVGSGSSTITVTVNDQFGNPVSGSSVNLGSTGTGNSFVQPGPTNASGVTTGTFSSSVAEPKTISAQADGVGINQTAAVTVTDQPPPGITHTLLAAGNDPANGKVYTTASISPVPNALITIAVMSHRAYGANPSPTISGGGMTAWDEVATTTFDVVGSPLKRVTIFRAMSTAPGSGPITITWDGNVSNSQWIVSQWEGIATSGTNGAGAIGQTAANAGDGVDGLAVALGAFGTPSNVAYGVFGVDSSNPAVTPGAGFTEISEQPSGETAASLMAEWGVNDPTIDASWSGLNGGALGVEIKANP